MCRASGAGGGNTEQRAEESVCSSLDYILVFIISCDKTRYDPKLKNMSILGALFAAELQS